MVQPVMARQGVGVGPLIKYSANLVSFKSVWQVFSWLLKLLMYFTNFDRFRQVFCSSCYVSYQSALTNS